MFRLTLTTYFILLFAIGYWCGDFKQERAKLKYANPKYIKDVIVFTGRRNRQDPYRTNMTGTTLMPYGNNVSFALVIQLKTGGDFRLVSKACDTLKSAWSKEFIRIYTNIPNECPFPTATYKFMNMELPPKNLPMPIMNGDFYITMELFITATKEKILEITTLLHFDQSTSRKG